MKIGLTGSYLLDNDYIRLHDCGKPYVEVKIHHWMRISPEMALDLLKANMLDAPDNKVGVVVGTQSTDDKCWAVYKHDDQWFLVSMFGVD